MQKHPEQKQAYLESESQNYHEGTHIGATVVKCGLSEIHEWYDDEFEHARLTSADANWLTHLRGYPVDDEWLARANRSIPIGSISLRKDTDPETVATVTKARDNFYGDQLGWSDQDSEFFATYKRIKDDYVIRSIPLATFINTQRALKAFGIDGKRLLLSNPVSIALSKDRLQEHMTTLGEIGIRDVAKAVNTFPPILSYSSENLRSRAENLKSLDLSVDKLLEKVPGILGLPERRIQEKIAYLSEIGINPSVTLQKVPGLLLMSRDTTAARYKNLQTLGLSAKTISSNPQLIQLRAELIREKMDLLESYGIDAKNTLKVFPLSVCCSSSRIVSNIESLNDLGFNAVDLINRQPVLLGYAPDTLKTKLELLDRFIKALGWEGGSARLLVEKSPTVLKLSNTKLLTHAHIFARFGRPDMKSSEVVSLLLKPLASHIIALGDEDTPYGISSVNRMSLPTAERESKADMLLQDKSFRHKLGKNVVRVYSDYIK